MGQNEITTFIILVNVVLLIFMGGITLFMFAYRKRKAIYEQEKTILSHQHKQDLLANTLNAQQDIMQDIGREIHDNVGQKLTLSSLYLQKILHKKELSNAERVFLVEASQILTESLQDLRQLSKSLTNPAAAQYSLVELLEREAQRVKSLGICRIELEINPYVLKIDNRQKNNLHRLIQEFIQNSLKHAQCSIISVGIKQENKMLLVHLGDNGQGFNLNQPSMGIGLTNMKRRANDLKASDYTVYSSKETGTILSFSITLT
jgi:signal transduction histidine kinase